MAKKKHEPTLPDDPEELRALALKLHTDFAQMKKQRDLYKRDLDKERQSDNVLFLQGLEPQGFARLHANFAEAMREIVAWSCSSDMKLPSVIDVQSFEAEQWQRLDEAIAASDRLMQELKRLQGARFIDVNSGK
jgi:hypothetical protein